MTGNLEGLEGLPGALKNVTIKQLCSVPCNGVTPVPEFICDFCKFVKLPPAKDLTLGDICPIMAGSTEQCRKLPPETPNSAKEFCEFCKSIINDDLEPSAPGNIKPSIPGEDKNWTLIMVLKLFDCRKLYLTQLLGVS